MTIEFDWNQLPDSVCQAIAQEIAAPRGALTPAEGRAVLQERVPVPDDDLLRAGRQVCDVAWILRQDWLRQDGLALDRVYYEAETVGLLNPIKGALSPAAKLGRLKKLQLKRRLREVLLQALLTAGAPTASWDALDTLPSYIIVPTAHGDDHRLFPHQRRAVQKLRERWQRDELAMRGLLVMPTGSGKTRTAVAWLLDDVVAAGRQVLWVTHNNELLRQTARAFVEGATRLRGRGRDDLRIRLVSGEYGAGTRVGAEGHDVVIATVQTLARNHDHLAAWLTRRDVVVVFDEAHHSPAPTWRRILELSRKTTDAVLGLTATPVRANDAGTRALINLYAAPRARLRDAIIHEADIDALVEQQILARPVPHLIHTEVDVGAMLTDEDERYLAKFDDLSAGLKRQIAAASGRNQLIVETYRSGPMEDGTFGKTIVFAVNRAHCELLVKEFAAQKVSAAAVYFGQSRDANREALEAFRDGRVRVLVNVEMLTEGVDVPDAESVFLTRPTASLPLFSQMVGRGLRGPAVGGTLVAHIVDFQDLWGRFEDWRLKFGVLEVEGTVPEPVAEAAEEVSAEVPVGEGVPGGPRLAEILKLAVAYGEAMAKLSQARVLSRMGMVPIGAYVFQMSPTVEDDDQDAGSRDRVLMVFAHEEPGYARIRSRVEGGQLDALKAERDWAFFFRDLPHPGPPADALADFREYVVEAGELPTFYAFAERDALEPKTKALELVKDDPRVALADIMEGAERAGEEYRPLIEHAWGSVAAYVDDVVACAQRVIRGEPDPLEERRIPRLRGPVLEEWPHGAGHFTTDHLTRTVESLLANSRLFPEGLRAPNGSISWSGDQAIEWAGYRPDTEDMVVNRLLDSPNVEPEILEYLIYHELLHHEQKVLQIYLGPKNHLMHGPLFREREHQHPAWERGDQFLDTFYERFFPEGPGPGLLEDVVEPVA